MADFFSLVLLMGAVAFPFIAMVLMWRRMKRVRAKVYDDAETPRHEQAWEEVLEAGHALKLGKAHSPNDDLIALGDRANHAHWPLNNP